MSHLEMLNIQREFGGIAALNNACFSARSGEVHALMGENGAGKSTLMKILAGAYTPDSGDIFLDGRKVHLESPHEAIKKGISIIYQEFSLANHLTVAENILIESLRRGIFVKKRPMRDRAAQLLSEMGFDDIDPDQTSGDLTVAQQQVVEICKALSRDCSILILDEPTAVLTNHETEKLFKLVRQLRDQGVCVIYISHRLDEIFSLCDRVTILKDGATVGTWETASLDHKQLVNLMIGRELKDFFPQRDVKLGSVALEVDNLKTGSFVSSVNLHVKQGEILGIGGLVGAGRTEVLRTIFGADSLSDGTIRIRGKTRKIRNPGDAVRAGIGLVPEDRKHQGCLLDLPIVTNAMMTPVNPHLGPFGLLRSNKERHATETLRQRLNLKTASINSEAGTLSGGNQQKVALMKWLVSGCQVLLLDEPTRGVDVGAKVEIYRVINELASKGVAIIMVSSEMLELIGMCDRVIVMREGQLAGELAGENISEEKIIELAMGRENVQ